MSLTPEQLRQATELHRQTGRALEEILVTDFGVPPFQMLQAKAFLHNMRAVDLEQVSPEADVLGRVPAEVARRVGILPLRLIWQGYGPCLCVAVSNPEDLSGLDEVVRVAGVKVQPFLALAGQVARALEEHYPKGPDV